MKSSVNAKVLRNACHMSSPRTSDRCIHAAGHLKTQPKGSIPKPNLQINCGHSQSRRSDKKSSRTLRANYSGNEVRWIFCCYGRKNARGC
ncbi:hypothetical protein CYMTET_26454 [Cymbomonas tetramitiformis]|uniref:Uncharacterized protein n=1 Tax=Cymbomonas tetramitiformis TaxID=36881 RepID=A0AAE0FTA4_9CHLO|nr:hypothetical protein CYMTET_26454 [Cymbomonas tetramitiformis]